VGVEVARLDTGAAAEPARDEREGGPALTERESAAALTNVVERSRSTVIGVEAGGEGRA
jgi:hypothetical protein